MRWEARQVGSRREVLVVHLLSARVTWVEWVDSERLRWPGDDPLGFDPATGYGKDRGAALYRIVPEGGVPVEVAAQGRRYIGYLDEVAARNRPRAPGDSDPRQRTLFGGDK